MKLETRIKEKDNKLVVVLPDIVVKNGALKLDDVLVIELRDSSLTIKRKNEKESPV